MNKPLTILYFAWLRERTGAAQEEIALPEGVRTVSALVDPCRHAAPAMPRRFRTAAPYGLR